MRFSICVPVYNVEKYLAECLDSIIEQTFNDFEIICVNDGSTDSSPKILEAYSSKDIRISIINKSNQGLLWARRDAIKVAKGEYILFIDSDDKYLNNNVLNILNEALNKHDNPDMVLFDRAELCDDVIKYTCDHFYESERLFDDKNIHEIRSVFITRNYFNSMFLKCVKNSLIKQDNTDYSVHNPQMAEDITQSVFFFDKCKTIVYIPEFLYLYRNNMNSITKAPLSFDALERKIVRRLFSNLFDKIGAWKLDTFYPDIYSKFFNKVYSFYCDRVIELSINKKNKNVAKGVLASNFFNEDNNFLSNKEYIKIANLKRSYKKISLGLIENRSSKISSGIFAYRIGNFFEKLYSKTFRRNKDAQ